MKMFLLFLIVFVSFARTSDGKRYNTETYYVSPDKARFICHGVDNNYYVLNVGKTDIDAKIKYGDIFQWLGNLQQVRLSHGQSYTFSFSKTKAFMALEIYNFGPGNAFVHGYSLRKGFPEFDYRDGNFFNIDEENLLRTIVLTSIAYVPIAGEALETIVEFFWPEDKEDVWSQIEDKVRKLIDTKTQEAINGILEGLLKSYQRRIKVCSHEINNPNLTKTVHEHFMNIAEDMIGLEKRFIFNSNDINFFLLPMYSAIINLKMIYYQYGIIHRKKIGLEFEHVDRLKYYIYDMIYTDNLGPIRHVHEVCEKKLDHAYANAYTEDIFDQLASVREFCAINGFENIPVWKAIIINPYITKKPNIPFVAYSTQFGRNTAKQSSEIIYPSYAPPIINGSLINPIALTVFLTSKNRIGGLKIIYTNGNKRYIGPTTVGKSSKIEFHGKKLLYMTARGTGQIDGLEFLFEDGKVVKTGTSIGDSRTFSLDRHHIVGFFMTGSIKIDSTQAANIAVVFQLIID